MERTIFYYPKFPAEIEMTIRHRLQVSVERRHSCMRRILPTKYHQANSVSAGAMMCTRFHFPMLKGEITKKPKGN